MMIFSWSSDLLAQYAPGRICALAETAEGARTILRSELDVWLREHREWVFYDEDGEELASLRAKFEADIAAEPTTHQSLWIMGSE